MRPFGLHLNALRAFEAAARLLSFSRAAEELNVSHSTISHHIKGLEQALGMDLFLRQNRRVVLTSAGEILYPVLERAFSEISLALTMLKESREKEPLKVTVTPSFANKWLMPRMSRFRDEHPGIEVQLLPSTSRAEFSRAGIDVGVRTGWGKWSGLKAEELTPVHMTPLCSPRLLEGRGRPDSPEGLANFTLIHADVSSMAGIKSEWREWLVAAGAKKVDFTRGLSFHDPGLALQAAIDGLGVAMGYVELAEADIAEGRLVRLFETEVRHPWSYYIVVPEDRDADLQTTIFCQWLRSQVGRDRAHKHA